MCKDEIIIRWLKEVERKSIVILMRKCQKTGKIYLNGHYLLKRVEMYFSNERVTYAAFVM